MSQAAGTVEKYVAAIQGTIDRPALKNWESIIKSGKLQRVAADAVKKTMPQLKQWQATSKGRLEELKTGAFDALRPLLQAGEGVYRSEEFQSFTATVSHRVRQSGESLRSIIESEEFKRLVAGVTTGMQDASRSWKPVTRTQEFQELKASFKSAGTDTVGTLVRSARTFLR